jgi:hypothetical protein
MIVFDLRCGGRGHVFEGWFASTDAYEAQRAAGLLACPLCGSVDIAKAPMAPALGPRQDASTAATSPTSGLFSGAPEEVKAMLAAAAEVQKALLSGSEAVGERFADEARAIHLGEAERRAIHGQATRDEAAGLVEDGIPIAPLPFPVVEPGEQN